MSIHVSRLLPSGSRLPENAAKKQQDDSFGIMLDKYMRDLGGKGLYGIDKGSIQRPLPYKEGDADRL